MSAVYLEEEWSPSAQEDKDYLEYWDDLWEEYRDQNGPDMLTGWIEYTDYNDYSESYTGYIWAGPGDEPDTRE